MLEGKKPITIGKKWGNIQSSLKKKMGRETVDGCLFGGEVCLYYGKKKEESSFPKTGGKRSRGYRIRLPSN